MKRIGSRASIVYLVVAVFVILTGIYIYKLSADGDKWATYPTNRHLYTNGKLTKSGTVTDRNGIVLASNVDGARSYNEEKSIRLATVHTIGDFSGNIATGVISAYRKELTGFDFVNGTYSYKNGGNDITLTIDANLCVTARKALGNHSGTIGVYNYKTGEILCMVSNPSFDPANTNGTPKGEGVYLNRLLSGQYTPGSVFKIVTAISALENISDVDSMTFTCDKGCEVAGEWVECSGNHGTLNFDDALAKSCNAAYAQLALELGEKNLYATANGLGFNKEWQMGKVSTKKSVYRLEYPSTVNFAWSAIGQSTDIVNPYHFMMLMGAIANGGETPRPYVVEDITTSIGLPAQIDLLKKNESMLDSEIATRIDEMLRYNVTSNYGDDRFPNLEMCGKTGTAQVDDKEATSWFAGYSKRADKPYAIVVVAEEGGYGITTAGSIANKVLQSAPTVD